jgi:peptide/nickel transport system permease protein
VSIAVGITAVLIAITLGTFVGAISGFFGGRLDQVLMRLTDMFLSLPQLPLLLLTIYLFRDTLRQTVGPETGIFILIVVIIGLLTWMPTARLVRAAFLSLKQKEFVEAARSIGAPDARIIWVHILPNVLSPVLVAATVGVGAAIITESALSFLGLGFPPDVPTWGRMLYDAQNFLDIAPYWAIFPGLLIFLTVLSINYMGDGLRDALDPRRTGT